MIIVDWIMAATIIFTLVLLAVCILLSRISCKHYQPKGQIPWIAARLRNTWLGCSIAFRIGYYWCVLFSILSTLVVVYLGCFEDNSNAVASRIILFSSMSLFTTICPYVVNLLKLARKHREAYCIIEKALINNINLEQAIVDGENIITTGFDD